MLSIRKRDEMKWGYNHASTLEEGGTIRDTVDMFGPTDLWEPVYAMYEDTNKHREFYGHWDQLSNRWNLLGMLHGTVLRYMRYTAQSRAHDVK